MLVDIIVENVKKLKLHSFLLFFYLKYDILTIFRSSTVKFLQNRKDSVFIALYLKNNAFRRRGTITK